MSTRWNAAELRRINSLRQLFNSPGMYSSTREWQEAVTDRVRDLVGTDAALFILASDYGQPSVTSAGVYDHQIKNLSVLLEPNEGNRRLQRLGSTAWTKDEVVAGEWTSYWESSEYLEFFSPNQFEDGAGFTYIHPPCDFAVLALFSHRKKALSASDELRHLLELLAPKWNEGVLGLRFARMAVDFIMGVGDVNGHASFLFECSGRIVRRSELAEDLISRLPEGGDLQEDARELARVLANSPGDYQSAKGTCGPELSAPAVWWRRRGGRLYRLVGTFVGPPGLLRRQVLVSVDSQTRVPVSGQELAEVYGIGDKLQRTAALILAGKSDEEIAKAMGIQVKSVKANIGNLRRKLGGLGSKPELLAFLRGEYRDELERKKQEIRPRKQRNRKQGRPDS